ncbi:MAG: DUF302 domain-containing protein [Candidatus Sulfopaludibacter sp.]|nr:DUF302 domain-containing protein [Candidatus Sulfopaludibacter sp.]
MIHEAAVTVYTVADPFERALPAVREALAAGGLTISGEIDISERIRRQLGLDFGPCRILLVDSPYLLVEALALDRSAAALLPLHVVISGREPVTHVHWISLAGMRQARLPAGAEAPLAKLHAELLRVFDGMARKDHDWPVPASHAS